MQSTERVGERGTVHSRVSRVERSAAEVYSRFALFRGAGDNFFPIFQQHGAQARLHRKRPQKVRSALHRAVTDR